MSRRASLFAKQNPGKSRPKVHFPDELVFLDNIKENDIQGLSNMLRRASLQVDISGINDAGLTPLHQAVLDGNMMAVRLLVQHGANVNKQDEDSWTALHAACAEGHAEIAKYLLLNGADKTILTEDGERPLDLVEPTDLPTIRVMLGERRKGACSPPPFTNSGTDDDTADDDEDEDDEDAVNEDQENNNDEGLSNSARAEK